MIVDLKVGVIEDPVNGKLVEWTLEDLQGHVVFRFGLVEQVDPAATNPMYGLTPDFFGLKLGDRVELVTGDDRSAT